jgi:hypothetical protein
MRGRDRGPFWLLGVVAMLGLIGCFGKGVTPNTKDGGAADRGPGDGNQLVDSGDSFGGRSGAATSTASSASHGVGGTAAGASGGATTGTTAGGAGISGTGGSSALVGGGTSALGSGGASIIGGISTGGQMSTGGISVPVGGGETATVGGSGGTTRPGGSGLAAGTSGAAPDAGGVDTRLDVAADAPATPGPPGAKCSVSGDCAAGNCVDSVCCDKPCSGCNACVKAMTGKDDGTCAPVASGDDPHDTCTDETTAKPCGSDGTCDGKGACRKASAGQKCGSASCSADGNTFTPEPKCDGNGACTPGTPQSCAPYQCAITGCARICSKQSDCDTGTYCNITGGTCAAQKTNGTTASQTYECQSGIIASGVCCNTACGECNSCTTGTCTPSGSGTVCGGGGKVCVSGTCQAGCWITGQYASSGATNPSNPCQSCQPAAITSGWSTKSDGTSCGTGKTCSAGVCQCTTGTDCGASGCINVNGNDNNHCGSCTNVCPAGKSCNSGTCACAKGAPACGGCLAWDFEWGSDPAPWSLEPFPDLANPNAATNIGITKSRNHGGTSSLIAPVQISFGSGAQSAVVSVALPCKVNLSGYSGSAYMYLAGDYPLTEYTNLIAVDSWTSSGTLADHNVPFFGNIPTNQWFEVSLGFSISVPVDHIGISLTPSTNWTGTMYLDDVVINGL